MESSRNLELKKTKAKSIKFKREVAKIGMSVSMALVCVSAFKARKFSKLHTLAGISLVAFSLYHANLYPKNKKNR